MQQPARAEEPATLGGGWTTPSGVPAESSRPRPRLPLRGGPPADHASIRSLSQVAAVVSSRSSIDEVLDSLVGEAKVLVRCRKALLLLSEEPAGDGQPRTTLVVRGSRGQYREDWWRSCIDAVGPECIATGTPQMLHDREHDATFACVPIRARDRSIGLLSAINSRARGFDQQQLTLLAVLGSFAGAAIENARLRTQSEYALLAGERNRIAKEMHDGLAQSLFSASLALEVCKRRVRMRPEEVEDRLSETQRLLSDSLTELRRYIYDLRPMSLERLGLAGAVRSKVHEIVGAGRLRGELVVDGTERPLPPAIETCVYRVSQEAMANVVKHAGAASFTVTLVYRKDVVELLVEDDGAGFDVDEATRRGETGRSLGLRSMRDRVSAEGGRFRIFSSPNGGARVWVTLPC